MVQFPILHQFLLRLSSSPYSIILESLNRNFVILSLIQSINIQNPPPLLLFCYSVTVNFGNSVHIPCSNSRIGKMDQEILYLNPICIFYFILFSFGTADTKGIKVQTRTLWENFRDFMYYFQESVVTLALLELYRTCSKCILWGANTYWICLPCLNHVPYLRLFSQY